MYAQASLLYFFFLFAYSADANGSRFIQQAIEVATIEEIVMVYEEITPYVCMLSIDVFGNHAIQKVKFHLLDSIYVCAYLFFFFY